MASSPLTSIQPVETVVRYLTRTEGGLGPAGGIAVRPDQDFDAPLTHPLYVGRPESRVRRLAGGGGGGTAVITKQAAEIAAVETTSTPPAPLPAHGVLLLVAVSGAVVAQGAYYSTGQRLAGTALILALASAQHARPLGRADLRSAPVVATAALAAWSIISAAAVGNVSGARSTVGLLGAVIIVFLICHRTSDAHRSLLASGLVAVGVLVALSGWIGVAWRVSPWTLEDQGLMRAATTLTYSNAAAGLLVPIVLLALARIIHDRRPVAMALGTSVLLIGVGATLSRAGILALVVGLVVLATLLGPKRVTLALVGPAIGALIALAGLAPSIPADNAARPALAVIGFLAGLATATLIGRSSARTVTVLGLLAAALSITAAVVAVGSSTVSSIRTPRLSINSPDRAHEARTALQLAVDHPLTGVGPGNASLTWTEPDGSHLTARYAHNEYLQTAADLGAIGLVLLMVVLITFGRTLWRAPRNALTSGQWAAIVAGLIALAGHSAFDFLWHVPAIPLVAAVLLGIAGPSMTREIQ